jgi:hypothetical protein
MEFERLKMERIDFRTQSVWKWRSRRIGIGLLLYFYYAYAVMFIIAFIAPTAFEFAGKIADYRTNHYLLMTTFGFLGSVFDLSRAFVITQNRIDYPVAWYITRPLQGVLMALFLYFAFRAGQLVFFSDGGTEVKEESINVYTLSILAILAGLFAEHSYARLYMLADKIIKPKTREAAWIDVPVSVRHWPTPDWKQRAADFNRA